MKQDPTEGSAPSGQAGPPARIAAWRIITCIACLGATVAVLVTAPNQSPHGNNVVGLFRTIRDAGLMRQVLAGVLFVLAIVVTMVPKKK